jgi:hypothetical protein
MMKLVYHIGLLIRLSEFESQCPYHVIILKRIQVDRSTQNLTGFCQSTFQYGDVAQLVRAGASYAQGRWFESNFHHQVLWASGRVVDGSSLENWRTLIAFRGFESHLALQNADLADMVIASV